MTPPAGLDPASPVPRYHQIAEAIRARIARGEIASGDALAPLRQAAEYWGVNLHTVRHAYAELARQGLVESRRAVGTRVVADPADLPRPGGEPTAPAATESRADFVARVAREALHRHAMPARALADALTALADDRAGADGGVVYVVECSQTQCEDLARQVAADWDVDARPWCLVRDDGPPPDTIVATYFHYNEIRRRWPERLAGARFAAIVVDQRLDRLVDERATGSGRTVVTLHELDEPTLEAVKADLSVVLPESRYEVRTRLVGTAAEALEVDDGSVPLVAPRVWGELSQAQRATGRALEVRYVFAAGELDTTGSALRWRPRHRTTGERGRT